MNTKAREIIIKTKKRLFGANIGNNISVFQGNGLDFSEIKEYQIGDDVKKINWKVTAKEQKPYINVFNEERELNIVVCFMVSGNIYFGSVRQKQELMSEILTLVGYSAIKNSDRFSTIFFSDKEEEFIKPTKNINLLYNTLEKALEMDSLGKSVDYNKLSEYLLQTIKQKSIIFVIGDFFEEVDFSLLVAKHEVYAIVVRDKFEEEPKFSGDISLIDTNSLKQSEVGIDNSVLKNFKAKIEKRDSKLFEHFLKHQIGAIKVYTDEDSFVKMQRVFAS